MNTEQKKDVIMDSSATGSRRKFLQKTAAGVAIASIPAKSVWATSSGGGGILNSIAASTHASGWTGSCMYLHSHGYWKNEGRSEALAVKFQDAFGASAKPRLDGSKARWDHSNYLKVKHGHIWSKAKNSNDDFIQKHNITLFDVMSNESFVDNNSVQICAMYLNAAHHRYYGVYFPVWNSTTERPFASFEAYANWLYANTNTSGFGDALSQLIDRHKVGSFCS